MLRAILLGVILPLGCATTGGNPSRPSAEKIRVQSIDWLNRTYEVRLGPDSYGPITVKDGRANFLLLDDDTISQTGDGSGWYRVDQPRYLDVNGDGIQDALITGAVSMGGNGFAGFTTADVYTLRRGKVVRLATIDATDITHIETCKRNIVIQRDHFSYWTYYWTGSTLKAEPADDCASPGHCIHLCVDQ